MCVGSGSQWAERRERGRSQQEREITVKTRLNRRDDSSAEGRKKGKELPPDQYKILTPPPPPVPSIHPAQRAKSLKKERD